MFRWLLHHFHKLCWLADKQPMFHLFSHLSAWASNLSICSSSLLGLSSDSSLFVPCELKQLCTFSYRNFFWSLASRLSFTAFWVAYFVFPGLENCSLVLAPGFCFSSCHFPRNENFFLLPTPFPCLDALVFLSLSLDFFPQWTTLCVSSSAEQFWNYLGFMWQNSASMHGL